MIELEVNTTISRPVAHVFDCLVDIERYSDWMPSSGIFSGCQLTTPGPIREGTTYVDRGKLGRFVGRVTEFHRPDRIVFRQQLRWLGIPVFEAFQENRLDSIGGHTRISHRFRGRLRGLLSVCESMLVATCFRERERTLTALKQHMESTFIDHR